MSDEADKVWQKMARALGRRSGHAPLTPAEAQEIFESLPDERLAEGEIDSIIEQVTSGELSVWTSTPMDVELCDSESEQISDDVLQLNRNEGDADAETDALLDELRRKALEDEQSNEQEDSNGLEGDSKPPAQSN